MSALAPYRNIFALDPFFPMMGFPGEYGPMGPRNALAPEIRIDVEENDDAYIVTAALAGVSKEDVDIQFDDDRLTISVEHKESKETQERNYIHKESCSWSASRSLFLRGVEAAEVSAKMDDGVLSVTLPKTVEEDKGTGKVPIE